MSVIFAVLATAGLFVWFLRLERSGRTISVVAIVVGLVIVEALIYQSQNDIPAGLIHPEYGSFSFRLVDLVIPAALLARLIHRTRGMPVHTSVLLWSALAVWLAAAGLLGVYEGNSLKLVGFHGKAIVYVGVLVLTASVPLEQYLAPGRFERFAVWCAGAALAFIAFDLAGVRVTLDLPLLPLREFGLMGTDAATIFTSVGVIALTMGLFADRNRGRLLGAAAPLLAAPAVADQRAAFIALAASLVIVVLASTFSRRRTRVTPTEIGLTGLAIAGVLLLSTMGPTVTGGEVKLPLQDRLTTTFTSYEETLTTRDRLNQWHAARPLLEERPLLGWGLGKEYVYYNVGYTRFEKLDMVHNIFGDLVLRSGLIGLALFGLALLTTAAGTARAWSWHESDRAAAFSLAVGAIVAGLVAKGMVESIFEKYRLTIALGLGIGVMISAGLPAEARAAVRPRRQGVPSTSKDRISPRMPARL